MKLKRLIIFLAVSTIFILIATIMPAAIFADVVDSFDDDLGPSTFTRPNFNLTAGSTSGFYYFDYTFNPSKNGTYSIEVVNTIPGIDTALFLYEDSFNSADPTANLIAADDDGGMGLYSLIKKHLAKGTQYIVVVTTYGSGVTGHVFATISRIPAKAAEPEPEPWVRGDQKMVCSAVWINEDNMFQFSFIYPYADNNWVRIYDMNGNMVYETDMPWDNPNIIVDLPDGMYTVKTFNDQPEPLQEFVIGKP